MFTINVIMKTKNKGNWNSISCISYRIFASKSCVTHGKSVRVLCARRECKEKLYFLLVTPRQIYSKFPVLRWNYSSLTLYLSVLKRFKLKLLYRRLKYKRSKTDLNCLQLLCNLLTSLSASNVMRKHQKKQLVVVDIMRLLIYCVGEMSLRISLANMSTLFLGVHSFIFRIFF